MFRYETLMLTVPEITKDETSDLEVQVEKTIKGLSGSMISFERWGKYRLAYPVNKNDYGVYFLARFETENGSIAKELKSYFEVRYPYLVMRALTTRLEDGKTLEYQRPESLEEAPAKDIDTFIREHKVAGSPVGHVASDIADIDHEQDDNDQDDQED